MFAWDLWNEIDPVVAGDDPETMHDFVTDTSKFVRDLELRRYGRSHPQTVSGFGPTLARDPTLAQLVFRHPSLDFSTFHTYEEGTIDYPVNTVDAALSMARLVKGGLAEITDGRPFLDSEHGPIHSFKDHELTLPEPFDDEYFRHMQWAHFAAGGAGGGMRWPNRHPHCLTSGMRSAQRSLSQFVPLVDWLTFERKPIDGRVRVLGTRGTAPGNSNGRIQCFACADQSQAIAWLVRADTIRADGMLDPDATPVEVEVTIPGLTAGNYGVVAWDTAAGIATRRWELPHDGRDELAIVTPPFSRDIALVIRRI